MKTEPYRWVYGQCSAHTVCMHGYALKLNAYICKEVSDDTDKWIENKLLNVQFSRNSVLKGKVIWINGTGKKKKKHIH